MEFQIICTFLLLCGLTFIYCNPPTSNAPQVVCLKDGCIRGTQLPGFKVPSFEAYMGIPYARPPIGNLRFSVSNFKKKKYKNFKFF